MAGTGKRHYPSKKKEELGDIKYLGDGAGGTLGEPTGAFWGSENRAYMDILTIKSLFQSEDWVFLAVDAIAHPISTLPMCVYTKSVVNGEVVLEKDMDHPVNAVLSNPNEWQTPSEFIYSMAADYCLAGNSFAWRGDAGSLYHIPAEQVLYRWGSDNTPDGYYIATDNDSGIPVIQFEVNLKDMAHVKRPNPSSALYGLSPFAPAKRSVLFNRYSQEYINNFYLKGATPQMLLELDKSADNKSLKRLAASFEQQYIGRRNQRRTMVLPKGVSAKTIENKIADQNFIDLVEQNTDRILATLKVPKHVVGRQQAGSLGSEETKSTLKYFWQTTITDTATALSSKFTDLFHKALGDDKVVLFDFENVPELQEDVDKKADTSNKLLSIWTLNEIRQKIWDLEPVEGGDTVASIRQDSFSLLEQFEPSKSAKKKAKTKSEEQENVDKEEKETLELADTKEPDRKKAALDVFIKQNIEAVQLLKKMAKQKDVELDTDKYSSTLSGMYAEMEDQYMNGYLEQLESVAKLGSKQQLELMFLENRGDDEAVTALMETGDSTRYRLLEARGLESFQSIRQTSLNNVMDRIEDGIQQGLGINEVEDLIKDYFKKNSVWRANTVARTETLSAITVGQEVVLDSARDEGIEFKKVWITARDERVRDAHRAVDGMTVDDGEFFDVGGESLLYPRDPRGSAANTINCRCTVLMIPKDEDFEVDE